MKKHYLITLITVIFCVLSFPLKGEETTRQESIIAFTDRDLYITGETIYFSAFMQNEGDSAERIIYVELITPDGKKIAGGKFMINGSAAYGCLHIPGIVVTGNYYLRAYTRFMRNPGLENIEYIPLRLINPISREVLKLEGNENSQNLPQAASFATDGILSLSTAKSVYQPREKAQIRLISKIGETQVIKNMTLTVVPENTLSAESYIHLIHSCSQFVPEGNFRMETKGVSLSGKLVEKLNSQPVSGGVVTLSVMGDRDFMAFRTENDGKFYFTLPDYVGSRELFLSATGMDQGSASLLIDNDFTAVSLSLPDPPFLLSVTDKQAALKLAVNQMVAAAYTTAAVQPKDSSAGESRPFYGLPTETLYIDKFVQLPTLEEYFNELPVDVRVKERREGKYFKFNSRDANMMAHDPLVLVDWVVISDVSRLLQISPQRIERIEIVNKPYVKGNLTYGGIISILSREKDFAGIDLPASGLFLKYNLLSPGCAPIQEIADSPVKPDARNTVYWLPVMNTATDQEISFNLPDTPGTYVAVIRGVLSDGQPFGQSVSFRVE